MQADIKFIIQETNPMLDDIHTGIRTIDDILTFEEATVNKDDLVFAPDYTKQILQRVKK